MMKNLLLLSAFIAPLAAQSGTICGPVSTQIGTCYGGNCGAPFWALHVVNGTGAIGTSVCAYGGVDSVLVFWSTGALAVPVPLSLAIPGSFGSIRIDVGTGNLGATMAASSWTIPSNPLLIGTDIHSQSLLFGPGPTMTYVWATSPNANVFTIQ